MSGRTQDTIAIDLRTRRDASLHDRAESVWPVKLVRDIRLLLIAVWLGAAVFFSFAVAPIVFTVLPARDLAGAVVSRTLGVVNTAGVLIGIVLLLSAFLFKNIVSNKAFGVEVASLALLVLSTFVGKWIIAARMQALRAAMGRPIDEVPQFDPLRIAFNSLHSYSVTTLSIAMVAAIISLMLIARRARG